jgi:hypothetical protein
VCERERERERERENVWALPVRERLTLLGAVIRETAPNLHQVSAWFLGLIISLHKNDQIPSSDILLPWLPVRVPWCNN